LATRADRREAIESALRDDPERSNRSIAIECRSDHKTAAKIRAQLESAGEIPRRTPTVPTDHGGALLPTVEGNSKATTHGAWSERRVGPLRDGFLVALRDRFPAVPDELLRVQAHRQAQLELLSAWADSHGVVRNARGDVAGAVSLARQLARDFEQRHDRLVEIEREAARVDPHVALEDYLAGMNGDRP
jgi:hypothetical protein